MVELAEPAQAKTSSVNKDLLSIGVVCIVLVISVALALAGLIGWGLVPPLFIALCGVWLLALSEMQSAKPQKYARSSFSLLGWGLLLIAFGGAWFIYSFSYVYWIYSILLIIIVIAVLAIAAALRRK